MKFAQARKAARAVDILIEGRGPENICWETTPRLRPLSGESCCCLCWLLLLSLLLRLLLLPQPAAWHD